MKETWSTKWSGCVTMTAMSRRRLQRQSRWLDRSRGYTIPPRISDAMTLCHRRNDMSEAYPSGRAGGTIRSEIGHAATLSATDWLCLGAAPTFAIMALLTGFLGGSQPDILCSAAEHTSPLSGMIPMYLLMSAFHLPHWLKLISSRGNGTRWA